MSLVLPNAKEKYERREEQNFREWVRRNLESTVNLAQNSSGTSTAEVTDNIRTFMVGLIIDNGGSPITTGTKGDQYVDIDGTVVAVTMLADQTGSIVIDVWKDAYANFPPVVGDSITASAKPTISAANKSQDATLTGWITDVSVGDVLRFNVDSCSLITRCNISLTVLKT